MFFCVQFEDMRTGVTILKEVSIEKVCQAIVIFHGLDCSGDTVWQFYGFPAAGFDSTWTERERAKGYLYCI